MRWKLYFFDYNRQHSFEIKVARIFNTYGPNMHPNDGRVVSNFIVQALSDSSITVYILDTKHVHFVTWQTS